MSEIHSRRPVHDSFWMPLSASPFQHISRRFPGAEIGPQLIGGQ
jgi:hypothetical protein